MPFTSESATKARQKVADNFEKTTTWREKCGNNGSAARIDALATKPILPPSAPRAPDTRALKRSSNEESAKLLLSNSKLNDIYDCLRDIESLGIKCARSVCTCTKKKLGDIKIKYNGAIAFDVCCHFCNCIDAEIIAFDRDLIIEGSKNLDLVIVFNH